MSYMTSLFGPYVVHLSTIHPRVPASSTVTVLGDRNGTTSAGHAHASLDLEVDLTNRLESSMGGGTPQKVLEIEISYNIHVPFT